ncbi:hypothetical protein ABMA28_003426 [Loxostege sticticalis]|uniref:Uncharacterized protein n=1 Tax=Loxostege sticticalis TaxID=481309 RepID=A0ABD0SX74_LOXSC
MRRIISPDHPAIRRLNLTTGDQEGEDRQIEDNHRKRIEEIIKKEDEEKMKKLHFDFKNEVPLSGKGPVDWRNENGKWIGKIKNDDEPDKMENKTTETEPKDKEAKIEDVKTQNEETPHPTPIKEVAPPL